MKASTLFLSLTSAMLAFAMQPAAVAAVAAEAERPLIPLFKADQIDAQCDLGLKELRRRAFDLENLPQEQARRPGKILTQWDALQIALEDVQGPMDLLSNVSPDVKVRANAEPCLVKLNQFMTALYQNKNLYKRIKAAKPTDAIDRKMRQDVLDTFEDSGVALSEAGRERMKEISKRLDELSQEFSRNVRDNNQKLVFTPDEVKGMQPDYLAKAKRDDKGNYLLGFASPEYMPFMEYADDSAARQRYQFAYTNRGTPRNLAILKETADLRREMAALFGFKSYADYMMRRRMAGSSAAVLKFLDEIRTNVTGIEKKELEELRAYEAEALKQAPAETKLMRWDSAYWQRRLKQARYSIDQNALRKYFPTAAAAPWVLAVSSTLYGVQFQQVDVPTWYSEVQYYDVIDSASRKRIAGIYLDLFPREGKYGHAAAWPVRGVSTLAGRTPVSALVANLDRDGLDSDELETLVHEFGHVLHGVLSSTRYVRHAGTSVELDFVEAPSQMYEEWARRKESLALISTFCKTPCPTVNDELVQRMYAAHNFGRGMRYARQLVYAGYDMALHGEVAGDPLALWKEIESATPLGHVAGTEFPGQFGHLMSGYGAGYYGYMWSQVLALDMLSAYDGKLMNPEVGRRYRKTILSRGGELRGNELVRGFLGRAPNSKAFFDEISGRRLQ